MTSIVFLCTENANRSQMAEAFASLHGGGSVRVWSAGSSPSGKVNPKAIRSMAAKGYDLTSHRSKSVTELPRQPFDFVITMGCGDQCPALAGRTREDWRLPDPKDLDPQSFDGVRDEIEQRVLELLARARRAEE